MNPRAFPKQRMVIGALLATLALSGCGAEAEPDADASDSAAPTSAAPTTDAASSSVPSSPAAEETEEPDAGSGDYESCGDGDCEVSFSGSVEFPLTGADGEWTVAAVVEADGVKVSLTKPDGLGGGGGLLYQPGCTLETRADGGGSLGCAEDLPEPGAGGIVVHLLELDGDTAVVQAVLG